MNSDANLLFYFILCNIQGILPADLIRTILGRSNRNRIYIKFWIAFYSNHFRALFDDINVAFNYLLYNCSGNYIIICVQ